MERLSGHTCKVQWERTSYKLCWSPCVPPGLLILLDETYRVLSVLDGTGQFVMDGLGNMQALGSREEEKRE